MNPLVCGRVRERGASLAMALILLVLLAIIGISAITVSNTQSRIAGNVQLQMRATAEAESALSRAEDWLAKPENTATLLQFGATNGLYLPGTVVDPLTMNWTDGNSVKVDAAGNQRYIVEVYANNRVLPGNSGADCGYGLPGPCPNINLFKITARGTAAGGAVRFAQTLFAVRSGG